MSNTNQFAAKLCKEAVSFLSVEENIRMRKACSLWKEFNNKYGANCVSPSNVVVLQTKRTRRTQIRMRSNSSLKFSAAQHRYIATSIIAAIICVSASLSSVDGQYLYPNVRRNQMINVRSDSNQGFQRSTSVNSPVDSPVPTYTQFNNKNYNNNNNNPTSNSNNNNFIINDDVMKSRASSNQASSSSSAINRHISSDSGSSSSWPDSSASSLSKLCQQTSSLLASVLPGPFNGQKRSILCQFFDSLKPASTTATATIPTADFNTNNNKLQRDQNHLLPTMVGPLKAMGIYIDPNPNSETSAQQRHQNELASLLRKNTNPTMDPFGVQSARSPLASSSLDITSQQQLNNNNNKYDPFNAHDELKVASSIIERSFATEQQQQQQSASNNNNIKHKGDLYADKMASINHHVGDKSVAARHQTEKLTHIVPSAGKPVKFKNSALNTANTADTTMNNFSESLTNHRFSVTPGDIQTSGWKIMNHLYSTKQETTVSPTATTSGITAAAAPSHLNHQTTKQPLTTTKSPTEKSDEASSSSFAFVSMNEDQNQQQQHSKQQHSETVAQAIRPNKTITHKLLLTTTTTTTTTKPSIGQEPEVGQRNRSSAGRLESTVKMAAMVDNTMDGTIKQQENKTLENVVMKKDLSEQRHEEIVIASINNLTRLAFGNQIRDTVKAINKLIDQQQQQLNINNKAQQQQQRNTTALVAHNGDATTVSVGGGGGSTLQSQSKLVNNNNNRTTTTGSEQQQQQKDKEPLVMRKSGANGKNNNDLLSKSLSKDKNFDLLLLSSEKKKQQQQSQEWPISHNKSQIQKKSLTSTNNSYYSSQQQQNQTTKRPAYVTMATAAAFKSLDDKLASATTATKRQQQQQQQQQNVGANSTIRSPVSEVTNEVTTRSKVHRVKSGQILPLNERKPTTFLPPFAADKAAAATTVATDSSTKKSLQKSTLNSRDIKRTTQRPAGQQQQPENSFISSSMRMSSWLMGVGQSNDQQRQKPTSQAPFTRLMRISTMPDKRQHLHNTLHNTLHNKSAAKLELRSAKKSTPDDQSESSFGANGVSESLKSWPSLSSSNNYSNNYSNHYSNRTAMYSSNAHNSNAHDSNGHNSSTHNSNAHNSKEHSRRTTTLYPWSLPDNSHLEHELTFPAIMVGQGDWTRRKSGTLAAPNNNNNRLPATAAPAISPTDQSGASKFTTGIFTTLAREGSTDGLSRATTLPADGASPTTLKLAPSTAESANCNNKTANFTTFPAPARTTPMATSATNANSQDVATTGRVVAATEGGDSTLTTVSDQSTDPQKFRTLEMSSDKQRNNVMDNNSYENVETVNVTQLDFELSPVPPTTTTTMASTTVTASTTTPMPPIAGTSTNPMNAREAGGYSVWSLASGKQSDNGNGNDNSNTNDDSNTNDNRVTTRLVSRPTMTMDNTVMWSSSSPSSPDSEHRNTLPMRQFATLPQTATTGEFFDSETIAQWPERYQTMEAKFTESMLDNGAQQQFKTTSFPPSSVAETITADSDDDHQHSKSITTKRTGEQSTPRTPRLMTARPELSPLADDGHQTGQTGVSQPTIVSNVTTSAGRDNHNGPINLLYHYEELPNNHKLTTNDNDNNNNNNNNNDQLGVDLAEPFPLFPLMISSTTRRREDYEVANSQQDSISQQQQQQQLNFSRNLSGGVLNRRPHNSYPYATQGYTLVGEITPSQQDDNEEATSNEDRQQSNDDQQQEKRRTTDLSKRMRPPYLHNQQSGGSNQQSSIEIESQSNGDNNAPVPYVSMKLYEQLFSMKPSSLRHNYGNLNNAIFNHHNNTIHQPVPTMTTSETDNNNATSASNYPTNETASNNNDHQFKQVNGGKLSSLMYTFDSGDLRQDTIATEELNKESKRNQSIENWLDWRERERNRALSLFRIASIRHQVPSPITMYPFNGDSLHNESSTMSFYTDLNNANNQLTNGKQISIDNRNDDDDHHRRHQSFQLSPFNNFNLGHYHHGSGLYNAFSNISSLLRAQRMVQKDELNARLSGVKSNRFSRTGNEHARSLPQVDGDTILNGSDQQQQQQQSRSREDFLTRLQRLKLIKLPGSVERNSVASSLRRSDDDESMSQVDSTINTTPKNGTNFDNFDNIAPPPSSLTTSTNISTINASHSDPDTVTMLDLRQPIIKPETGNRQQQTVSDEPEAFNCTGKPAGFYPDLDTVCQRFFHCSSTGHILSFNCPRQTRFDKLSMKCSPWYDVTCDLTTLRHIQQLDSLGQTQGNS